MRIGETLSTIGGSHFPTVSSNYIECRGKCLTKIWQPRRQVILQWCTIRTHSELPGIGKHSFPLGEEIQ